MSSRAPLANLTVEARGDWLLTTQQLARDKTDGDGRFTLKVPDILDIDEVPRSFRIRVLDVTKRALTMDRELAGTGPSQDLGDVTIQRADLDGLLVTNLTGTAKFVSDDNAVKLLVDGGEAFGRIADDIRDATRSVNMTQLFFDLPPEFHHPAEDEKPALVFKFLAPPLEPIDPLNPNPPTPAPRGSDDRPERLLIDEALTDRTIRIRLNEPALGWPEGIFWLAVLTPLAAGLGVGGVGALAALVGSESRSSRSPRDHRDRVLRRIHRDQRDTEDATHIDDAKKYFGRMIADAAPATPRITVTASASRHRRTASCTARW